MTLQSPSNEQAFPFEYKPVHPSLHQYYTLPLWYRLTLKPLLSVVQPILLIPRMLAGLLCLCIQDICAHLINMGTDQTVPLSHTRRYLLLLVEKLCCMVCLICQGYVVTISKKKNTQKQRARILAFNHTSIFDIPVLGIIGCDCIVAKAAMTNSCVSRRIIKATRSIVLGKSSQGSSNIIEERYGKENGWPPLMIFTEGTDTPKDLVLRQRTGVFRIGIPIQPAVIKYHEFQKDTEWLFESALEQAFQVGKNFFGWAEVRYLDIAEPKEGETPRQFADRVGKAMADELQVEYVPYTAEDVAYFVGKGSIEKCSPEYLRDYGWMGQLRDYKQLCKKAGLSYRFEWPRAKLGLE